MKNYIILSSFLFFLSCKAQENKLQDLSKKKDLNYILSNIIPNTFNEKSLFNDGLYIKTFEINDSKITNEKKFEESDEVLSSLFISITADGDYYVDSKLYKIEGLINPLILETKELSYPNIHLKIEFGLYNNRISRVYILRGLQ